MKTITYNPETHALVPREPNQDMIDAMPPVEEIGYWAMCEAAIAAAPQPEQVDVGSVGWKHDCAALCANDIELWIDRCPHCGKPRHNHPPTDDELLNKAEPVDSEPAMWVMKHIRSGDLAQAKPNQKALHPRIWSQEHLYTTPQPDRVAELREICAAIDDPACDPTLTTVECIKKLKAENERLKLLFVKAAKGKGENLKECFSLQHQLAASQAYTEQLREALEAVIKVHGYESGIPVEALSLSASTEALDAYVAEKVKESPKVKTLTAQVAALEAEIVRLREVIFDMAGEEPGVSWGKADKVLSTPFTPTALLELIETVEKLTIEQCADLCSDSIKAQSRSSLFRSSAEICAGEIRALPTGQIRLEELL